MALSVAEGWLSIFAACAAPAHEGQPCNWRAAFNTEMQVQAQHPPPILQDEKIIELFFRTEAKEKKAYHYQLHLAEYAVRVSVLTVQA